jgi:hypothetical protein
VRLALVLLVLAGLLAWQYDRPPGAADAGTGAPAEENTVQAAWTARRSGVWLEAAGRVTRLLADDNEGSRHQRFIMDVGDGHTVMVAHNIDLAERVPARVGDILTLRGRYEWNGHGGVIHWTHHDPQGREPGGWIRRGDAVFE